MTKMVTTLVDVMIERDLRSGAIVGATVASPYSSVQLFPGNLEALAFDRSFNHQQVSKLTGRDRARAMIRLLGLVSAAACLMLTTGLVVGIIVSA